MQIRYDNILAFLERETITGKLRTRVFSLEEPLVIVDFDGIAHPIAEYSRLLVVDTVGLDGAMVDAQLDVAELTLHRQWALSHGGEETRTPHDLRAPAFGGRETEEVIPF